MLAVNQLGAGSGIAVSIHNLEEADRRFPFGDENVSQSLMLPSVEADNTSLPMIVIALTLFVCAAAVKRRSRLRTSHPQM